jgi:hypothetical protein
MRSQFHRRVAEAPKRQFTSPLPLRATPEHRTTAATPRSRNLTSPASPQLGGNPFRDIRSLQHRPTTPRPHSATSNAPPTTISTKYQDTLLHSSQRLSASASKPMPAFSANLRVLSASPVKELPADPSALNSL